MLFGSDWWATPPARPWARFGIGLAGAMGVAFAVMLTIMALSAYAVSEGRRVGLGSAALWAFAPTLAYGALAAAPGLLALWATRRRGWLWFLAAGALAGAEFYGFSIIIWSRPFVGYALVAIIGFSALAFVAARLALGIRKV